MIEMTRSSDRFYEYFLGLFTGEVKQQLLIGRQRIYWINVVVLVIFSFFFLSPTFQCVDW